MALHQLKLSQARKSGVESATARGAHCIQVYAPQPDDGKSWHPNTMDSTSASCSRSLKNRDDLGAKAMVQGDGTVIRDSRERGAKLYSNYTEDL